MPLQPDGNYTIPDGTYGAPDQTVYSARYNGWVNDIATVLNQPRPINKGGTNATNAADARANLQTEVRTQLVSNFTAHAWEAGSFFAAASASSNAPNTTDKFYGICYMEDANNLTVEARSASSTVIYTRRKSGGTWDPAWTVESGAFVRFDAAQSLNETQREQARKNVYAAPFDAYGYYGLQANGSMTVAQESLATSVANGAIAYQADLFSVNNNVTGLVWSFGRGGFFVGEISYYVAAAVASGATAPAAGSNCQIRFAIEADRTERLSWGSSNARPITLAFFLNSTVAGTIPLAIRNSALDRSYVTPISMVGGGGWEFKTITIPGDVAGTWLSGPGVVGMWVSFGLCIGSNLDAPAANAWQAGNFTSLAGSINVAGAVSRQLVLGQIMVLPGNEAPTQDRLKYIVRPFWDELRQVRRYWTKTYNYSVFAQAATMAGAVSLNGLATSTTAVGGFGSSVNFIVPMRTAPTVVFVHPDTGTFNSIKTFTVGNNVAATPAANAVSETGFQVTCSAGSGYTAGQPVEMHFHYAANARF